MDGLFLLFFTLGSIERDNHERILPEPLNKIQSILEDAHIYKNYQNLSHEKIIENLTTSPGTFSSQSILTKFKSKEKASTALNDVKNLLDKESLELQEKVETAKLDEKFNGSPEEFKKLCAKKKNQAALRSACSTAIGIFSLFYLKKNSSKLLKYMLTTTMLTSLTFGLWSGLEAKISADKEDDAGRLLALDFEKKVLSDLSESLKN